MLTVVTVTIYTQVDPLFRTRVRMPFLCPIETIHVSYVSWHLCEGVDNNVFNIILNVEFALKNFHCRAFYYN